MNNKISIISSNYAIISSIFNYYIYFIIYKLRFLYMKANFKKTIEYIFSEEGGFVDNPRDPGGATNM